MSFNLDNMADVLRRYGLKVVEVDGWKTRGYAQQDLKGVGGILWHHTATTGARNPANGNMPTLNVLTHGRRDLAGPLSQLGLGRDGTVYVVATGVCNHAGSGSAPGLPVNMLNHWMIGVEMESSGEAPWDWTAEMLREAPKLGAALELGFMMNLAPEARLQLAHSETSDAGKIDPAGWPGGMNGLRASINAQIAIFQKGTAPSPVPKPTPAPAKPAPAKPAGSTVTPLYEPDAHWRVDPGDTLTSAVSWMNNTLGLNTSVAQVAAYNGIKDANRVQVGERIWPPTGRDTWTVDPGDTLTKLVNFYQGGLTVAKLQYANGINNPNVMPPVGSRLQVPK